jgi:hypothetical protein
MPLHPPPALYRRLRARGVSMIFALMTLVALSLAAVGLIRSVDSGALILGNMAFKQDTQLAADDASRSAIGWLAANIADAVLNGDSPANGYYATTRDTTASPLDVTGNRTGTRALIDWNDDDCAGHVPCLETRALPEIRTGSGAVTARYVVLRLCDATGDPTAPGATMNCARPLATRSAESGERGSLSYANAQRIGTVTVSQYFRVLVRARGGRGTVTYTETLVHF